MRKLFVLAGAVCTGLILASYAVGAEAAGDRPRAATERAENMDQERVYGGELMTAQERREYQAKMRAATSAEEREALRLEHHERMQERARSQGKTLPEAPPPGMGPGSGMGRGMGRGMGPGGGMAPGGGAGPGVTGADDAANPPR